VDNFNYFVLLSQFGQIENLLNILSEAMFVIEYGFKINESPIRYLEPIGSIVLVIQGFQYISSVPVLHYLKAVLIECTLFCNLQSRSWTHAVLVIGLYELLGNSNMAASAINAIWLAAL
jgi:hypothetical protein